MNRNFPKFKTDDNESWIEVQYLLTDEEYLNIKDEYKGENNTFTVRKYLKSDIYEVKSNQSNIYS